MGRLYFHSPTRAAELSGAERHHLAKVALGPARNAWDVDRPVGLDHYTRIVDRIFPLVDWIRSRQRLGGKVYRRTVIVVEDWEEVPRG